MHVQLMNDKLRTKLVYGRLNQKSKTIKYGETRTTENAGEKDHFATVKTVEDSQLVLQMQFTTLII